MAKTVQVYTNKKLWLRDMAFKPMTMFSVILWRKVITSVKVP